MLALINRTEQVVTYSSIRRSSDIHDIVGLWGPIIASGIDSNITIIRVDSSSAVGRYLTFY